MVSPPGLLSPCPGTQSQEPQGGWREETLGSASRAGCLEMSCGVSTWWGGRGARVSWQMSPGRKGEWGWRSEESLFSPRPPAPVPGLPHSHTPPADCLLSPELIHGALFSVPNEGVGGPDWPLSVSCVQRRGWPAHLLGARAPRLLRLWGEAPGSRSLHMTPPTP